MSYWPSLQVLKSSDLWKKMDKKMKWTFLGMWAVEDSQFYTDNPDCKLQPNLAYHNKRKSKFKPKPRFRDEESSD